MIRVWFVNRFYAPDTPATGQLLADLSHALSESGMAVGVITTGAPPLAHRRERKNGIDVIRIPRRFAATSVPAKALDFLKFSVGATWHLWRETRRGDIIVAMTDPPLIGVTAAVIAWIRNAGLIHWVQDIYPEVVEAITGRKLLRPLKGLRNRAWQSAKRCVVLGREMADVLHANGVPSQSVVVIPNWAPRELKPIPGDDPAVQRLRSDWGLEGKFVIAYSGNLGRVHTFSAVLDAAALLRDESRYVFLFVGGGPARAAVEREVAARRLPNVRFIPAQPREMLNYSLAVGDVHLITLRAGCEPYVFPSKLYGAAAIGRPVLFVGPPDCEVASIVRSHGFGMTVDATDAAGLAAKVRVAATDRRAYEEYCRGASRFADEHSATQAASHWQDVVGLSRTAGEVNTEVRR